MDRWFNLALTSVVALLATIAIGSLHLENRDARRRIEALEQRVETLESGHGSQEVALDAHAEALIDWYKYREARAAHWGSGHYWAAKALEIGGN